MEAVGDREAAGGQDRSSPASSATRLCWSSTRSWWPSASARYAKVVGRENVIAGADCGFATFAGSKEVHPSIVWAKFKSLVEGAKIASKQLWGR